MQINWSLWLLFYTIAISQSEIILFDGEIIAQVSSVSSFFHIINGLYRPASIQCCRDWKVCEFNNGRAKMSSQLWLKLFYHEKRQYRTDVECGSNIGTARYRSLFETQSVMFREFW